MPIKLKNKPFYSADGKVNLSAFLHYMRWDRDAITLEFNEAGETLFYMCNTSMESIFEYLQIFLPKNYEVSDWFISEAGDMRNLTISIQAQDVRIYN